MRQSRSVASRALAALSRLTLHQLGAATAIQSLTSPSVCYWGPGRRGHHTGSFQEAAQTCPRKIRPLLRSANLLGAAIVPHLHRSDSQIPDGPRTTGTPRRVIAVGISGGVDSAVAALMLKEAGHDVVGVFMRNWDESEEKANANCSVEADLKDAQSVCRHVGIPLHEADFVSEYWTRVFANFVAQCGRGLTPNPDLACNRHIKFDALLRFAKGLGADTVATGHYARLRHCPDGGPSELLWGIDPLKDQSYFLAAVPGTAFRDVIFPLGTWLKSDVRRAATAAGVPSADRRSSAGICFIGRRSFGEFLEEYAEPVQGQFVDVDQPERPLGVCRNMLALTHGQRAGISGATDRMYVVGKDLVTCKVFVATGKNHPALFTASAQLRSPSWIAGAPPAGLTEGLGIQLGYKARYGQPTYTCTAQLRSRSDSLPNPSLATGERILYPGSRYCRLSDSDAAIQPGGLEISFNMPARAITPQQAFVMYDGEVCLGTAPVAVPGPSLHELKQSLPPGYVYVDSVHQQIATAKALAAGTQRQSVQ